MATNGFSTKTARSITAQTAPLALAFSVECICAIIVSGQFKDLADATVFAAVYSACVFSSYFVTFVAEGFRTVSVSLIARCQEEKDKDGIWQVARRDIVFSMASTLLVAALFSVCLPYMASFFWAGIELETVLWPVVFVVMLCPLKTFSQSIVVLSRALGETKLPTIISVLVPLSSLVLNMWLIPAYGIIGALVTYSLVYFICEPLALGALLLTGKLPFKRTRNVKDEKDEIVFHVKKAVPEIGASFVHKAGGMCLSFASGMLAPAAMLATSFFLDFVDATCSVGIAAAVPVNAFSSRSVRCLKEGLASVLSMTALVVVPVTALFPIIVPMLSADIQVQDMLLGAGWLLVAYVVISNAADVVGAVLRGKLLNEQVGGWATISMLAFRCFLPFVAVPFGFSALMACFAFNRLSLLLGYVVISIRHRTEFEY